jgi:signal transduction histidine kinase
VERVGRIARRYGFDVLIVLAAIDGALEVALRDDADAPRSSPWFAVPAAVAIVLPLLWRRRWPFGAPALVWLLAAGVSLIDGRLVVFANGVYAAGAVAAFLLGHVDDPRQSRIGLVITVLGSAIVIDNDPSHQVAELFFVPGVFVMAWLAGFALRERGAQAEAAELRAEHAERERESAARLAVAEERARIARELHDIVAHAVSVMVLRTGAVRHRLPAGEDAEALQEVERTGRTALTEMRRLLGALRREEDDIELGPQPGLDSLDPLLDAFGKAGLPVRLQVDGESAPLPRGLDLSAYRIIQEGLTNALKHAQASQADVVVRYGADELRIDVRDDGHGPVTGDGLGHGLVGVRERVRIYGGEMSAGLADGGGFLLSTRLPLDGERR